MGPWPLFWRPLEIRLSNTGKIIMCAACLHNFCHDKIVGTVLENPINVDDNDIKIFVPSDVVQHVHGNSMMRDILVEKIHHSGLVRPA